MYLPLCEVADKTFENQGGDIRFIFTTEELLDNLFTHYHSLAGIQFFNWMWRSLGWIKTGCKNIKHIEKIQRSMTRCFPFMLLDNNDRLLMTNIPPLTMRREYTDIVFFWKCLYGSYDVDVNDYFC